MSTLHQPLHFGKLRNKDAYLKATLCITCAGESISAVSRRAGTCETPIALGAGCVWVTPSVVGCTLIDICVHPMRLKYHWRANTNSCWKQQANCNIVGYCTSQNWSCKRNVRRKCMTAPVSSTIVVASLPYSRFLLFSICVVTSNCPKCKITDTWAVESVSNSSFVARASHVSVDFVALGVRTAASVVHDTFDRNCVNAYCVKAKAPNYTMQNISLYILQA